MSYKLGLLLSMTFVMAMIFLCSDLVVVSSTLSELDSIALTAAYQISVTGRIDDNIVSFVENQNAHIESLSGDTIAIGNSMTFRVYREYQPLVLSTDVMTLSVTRTTVVGFLANA